MARAPNSEILLNGESLTAAQVVAVARRAPGKGPRVKLAASARARVAETCEYIRKLASGDEAIYGVNTGFGLLSDVRISKDQLGELQVNLLRSHATGVGNPLPRDVVRAAMLLRANTLARGNSGCAPSTIDAILALLDRDVVPWVPEQGSVGACGDLAPLAHLSLVLIGEGQAYYKGKLISGKAALKAARLKPIRLGPKEGLSLINGTQIMTAIGALVVHDAIELCGIADFVSALSLEAFRGTSAAFHRLVHEARPHPGQLQVANNLRKLVKGSEIASSHSDCDRVQDPYSFRCIPQVHGVSREYVERAMKILEVEFNSSTDNPLVFSPATLKKKGKGPLGGEIISGGNFHGQYVAMAMDTVAIALSELANISDQRIQKLINPHMSRLPAFLTPDPGLNSGMMIVQVASASLVSENKILSHPASVDSIPTSADKEDHVSMGVTAARKARQVLHNVQNVLAMEILCAGQGIEFLRPLKTSPPLELALALIRKRVPPVKKDRAFHLDIAEIRELIQSSHLIRAVEAEVGSLH